MTPTFECKMSDVEMLGSSEDANSRCKDAISVPENHLLNFSSTAEDLIAVESEDHKDAAPFDNIDAPLLDYDWLLSRNNDLHHLVFEQGKGSQDQVVIFNDVWQKLNQVTQAKEQVDWQRQALWSDNIHLKGELAQLQHALAVERFQHSELRKAVLLRDELISSLRQEASSQRDFTRLTSEHLTQVTCALTLALRAPGSEEARLILTSTYGAQVKENERLREEVGALTARLDQSKQTQRPRAAATFIAPRPSGKPSVISHPGVNQVSSPSGIQCATDTHSEHKVNEAFNANSVYQGLQNKSWMTESHKRSQEEPTRRQTKRGKAKRKTNPQDETADSV